MAIDYSMLKAQMESLAEGCAKPLPVMANASALLWETLEYINWAGFYLAREHTELVLGPFQGKPACTVIQWGKGVCGTAAAEERTLIVPDVHLFAGHIACDSASRSEVVIPLILDGIGVIGVLDIDSPINNRFDEVDAHGLEMFAESLVASCDWSNGLI